MAQVISKGSSVTITVGALIGIVVVCAKVYAWADTMTKTVEQSSENLTSLAAALDDLEGRVRFKGEQDWTRGQMNRFATDAEKAERLGKEWPKVWDKAYDAKE